MATNHEGCVKSFSWYSRSWYGKTLPLDEGIVDELTIGFYTDDDECFGEFIIQWEDVARSITPRLKAFDDSWNVLANIPELLEYLASVDSQNTPIDKFVDNLLRLGFKDRTAKNK